MSDLTSELRTLVTRYGTAVLDDADGFRATLDDFLDEKTPPGDINLLVDAVRFGSLDRLTALLAQGAQPDAAIADVAHALANRRGGDRESAYWACAVLGYAAGQVSHDLIPQPGLAPTVPPSRSPADIGTQPSSDPGAEAPESRDSLTQSRPHDPDETRHPHERSTMAEQPSGSSESGRTGGWSRSWTAAARNEAAGKGASRARVLLSVAVVVVILLGVGIYLRGKPSATDGGASADDGVPVAEVLPAFAHFGPGGLGEALQACGRAYIPGAKYEEYNCTFADNRDGKFDLELTEKDPVIVNRDGQLPEVVEHPPANTIVTTAMGKDSYHAYFMQWENNGADEKKNTGDDEVMLTLYDVDPSHPGAAIFSARDSQSHPLTRDQANRLLESIGPDHDKFPLPVAFQESALADFAAPFLESANLQPSDCLRAFTVFKGEFEHDTCQAGPVKADFGLVEPDPSVLERVRYWYRGSDYSWAGETGGGRLTVSQFAGVTRLYWDQDRRQSYGVLTASSQDFDEQALIAYFESFQPGAQVVAGHN